MPKTEVPIHPEFTRALKKINGLDSNKLTAARTLLKRTNHTLITNYDTHTAEATIPFTRLSTDELDLPDGLFSANCHPEEMDSWSASRNDKSKTSSQKILDLSKDKNLKVVLFPGFALPPAGTPVDNERVSRMINLVGHAVAKGQSVEIYATGLAISRGGKVQQDWPGRLEQNGFVEHGQTSADFLRANVLPQSQTEKDSTVVVFLGESMGCYNARETARALGETGIETHLYLKNPPGPEGLQSPFLKKAQVIMGYGIESGIRKLTTSYTRKGTPQGRQDEAFFKQLSNYLETEKDFQPDDKEQRKLKWQSVLADARNLLGELPFSTDGITLPTIVDTGIKDLTSFTWRRLENWRSGIKEVAKGNITHVLDRHAHTPQHDIWEWARRLT
jgi:surfactin synthase thioesterase subunit